MFNKKKTSEEIKKAAWSYFKSDQLGPKRYKSVNDVISVIMKGEKLKPLVCWSNGVISWGTGKLEAWVNKCDVVNNIPVNQEKLELNTENESEKHGE